MTATGTPPSRLPTPTIFSEKKGIDRVRRFSHRGSDNGRGVLYVGQGRLWDAWLQQRSPPEGEGLLTQLNHARYGAEDALTPTSRSSGTRYTLFGGMHFTGMGERQFSKPPGCRGCFAFRTNAQVETCVTTS